MARSQALGGRCATATDGDGVCAHTHVNLSGGTPLDVFDYTYNANGELTAVSDDNSAYQYAYNADSEETSQGDAGSYTYDALDNRIGMDENGTQTWTLYDGSDPVMDFNGSGSLEMRYLNGPTGDMVDSIIARESAGGTIAWYLPDRLGTIRDLINNSGSIIDHVDYSAFGTVLDESSPSNGDRMMGFGGMERDTVTGLNLAVNRVQNPGTGRWTSQDPDGFRAGDSNLNRFVGNAPTDSSDPSGLDDERMLQQICGEYDDMHSPAYVYGLLKDDMEKLGYTQQQIEQALEELRTLFHITGHTRGVAIQDNCYIFITDCQAKLSKQPFPKHLKVMMKRWYYPDPAFRQPSDRLSHGAFEITLPGGRIVYVDDGWWGGASGNWFSNDPAIFWPVDVPPYVTPF